MNWKLLIPVGMLTLLGMSQFFVGCKHSPIVDDMIMPIDTMDNPIDTTGVPCDSNVVYFTQQILPILQSSCALSGCHDAITAEEDIILTSYSNVMNSNVIDLGDPSGSDLFEVLVEDDLDKRMPPPPAAALTSDQISLIQQWIAQGAQDLECDQEGPCDLEAVSFSADLQPILQNYCLGCHSGAQPIGIWNLSNYAGVKSTVDAGRLIGAIDHQAGFVAMPQGGAKLSQCRIDQFKTWVDNGAANN